MKLLLILIASTVMLNCTEDEVQNVIESDGTLAWYGAPELDGCGLVLEVDTTLYFISEKKNAIIRFTEQDSNRIEVRARYLILEETKEVLGCQPPPIKIVGIARW